MDRRARTFHVYVEQSPSNRRQWRQGMWAQHVSHRDQMCNEELGQCGNARIYIVTIKQVLNVVCRRGLVTFCCTGIQGYLFRQAWSYEIPLAQCFSAREDTILLCLWISRVQWDAAAQYAKAYITELDLELLIDAGKRIALFASKKKITTILHTYCLSGSRRVVPGLHVTNTTFGNCMYHIFRHHTFTLKSLHT